MNRQSTRISPGEAGLNGAYPKGLAYMGRGIRNRRVVNVFSDGQYLKETFRLRPQKPQATAPR